MKLFKKPQKYLGPSQVHTVLGYDNFMTTDELRDRMENGYTIEIAPDSPLRLGQKYERKCRGLYIRTTGIPVKRAQFISKGRLGGIADGLVQDGGLEIKCQFNGRPPKVQFKHKVQAVTYMHLYDREWWDIMVCSIDTEKEDVQAIIERVYRTSYHETWTNKWYPCIIEYMDSVNWHTPLLPVHPARPVRPVRPA